MPKKLKPSLLSLPVELHHRIFDYLDGQTILLSVRRVCKQLNAIVYTYTRYNLDLSSVSKTDFCIIWHIVRPEYIYSLTLSNEANTPGQIGLFISLVDINKFTRLHSLSLLQINHYHLEIFLQHIINCSFTSLIIKLQKSFEFRSSSVQTLLSSVIAQPTLRNFHFSCSDDHIIDTISWPISCTIQHLATSRCYYKDFCVILNHLPDLQILELDNCRGYMFNSLAPTRHTQLTSLTLTYFSDTMNILELFLRFTPSLVHLRLTNYWGYEQISMSDGSRWEHFIQRNLRLLTKFEFYFSYRAGFFPENPPDFNSIIDRFRSPFWLEEKRWFIACDYIPSRSEITIYSIPTFKTNIHKEFNLEQISYFNFSPEINCTDIMDCVNIVKLNLTEAMANDKNKKNVLRSPVLFRNTTKLDLQVYNDWPSHSIRFLSALIDFSHLNELGLYINYNYKNRIHVLACIIKLLKRASHLHTLRIHREISMELYSMLPHHIKHLIVSDRCDGYAVIRTLKAIECTYLSSVSFQNLSSGYRQESFYKNVIKLFTGNNGHSTYCEGINFLHIWIDKKIVNMKNHHRIGRPIRRFCLLCSCAQSKQ